MSGMQGATRGQGGGHAEATSKTILTRDEVSSRLSALRELKRRRSHAETSKFAKWRDDPIGFVEERLLGFLWSKQKAICRSVVENRLTAVPSCHDAGKSKLAAFIAAWWVSCHEPGEAFVVTLAPTEHQVRGILWREINRVHVAGGLPGRCNRTEWLIGNELVGFGRSPQDNKPTNIQGIHAKYVLVIGDEACGLSRLLADGFSSLYSNEFSRALMIGNPDDPDTFFGDICKAGTDWNVVDIDGFETPNFTNEGVPEWLKPLLISKIWVNEKRKDWGEGSMRWESKVRGKFPEQSADALVPQAALLAAVERGRDLDVPELADELGVDVARFGDDASVIFARKGPVTWRHAKERKRDTTYIADVTAAAINKLKVVRVKIDDAGLGGGVTDRLVLLQSEGVIPATCEIVPVNVGEAPRTNLADERFKNLRAEVNWGMRTKFVDGAVTLVGDECDDMLAQASQVKVVPVPDGSIAIEQKKDMKKRTKGVSPDDWDALVLCHAAPLWSGASMMEYWGAINDQARQQTAPAATPGSAIDMPHMKPKPAPAKPTNLSETYAAGLQGFAPKPPVCKNCGRQLGATRVSDGVDAWHQLHDPECRR